MTGPEFAIYAIVLCIGIGCLQAAYNLREKRDSQFGAAAFLLLGATLIISVLGIVNG